MISKSGYITKSITMKAELIERINAACEQEDLDFTKFVRRAIVASLKQLETENLTFFLHSLINTITNEC